MSLVIRVSTRMHSLCPFQLNSGKELTINDDILSNLKVHIADWLTIGFQDILCASKQEWESISSTVRNMIFTNLDRIISEEEVDDEVSCMTTMICES